MDVPGGWQFVAYQLHAEQRLIGYSYTAQHPEWNDQATDSLAQQLYAGGVADIRDLALYVGQQVGTVYAPTVFDCGDAQCSGTVPVSTPYVAQWVYNKRSGARLALAQAVDKPCDPYTGSAAGQDFIAAPDCSAQRVPTMQDEIGTGLSVSLPERWNLRANLRFIGADDAHRTAVLVPILWQGQSTWVGLRAGLLFLAGAVVAAVPGFAAAIGTYVFGAEVAAAYPALVQLATNTAFNAALGGQDIEHAVGAAVASYAGAQTGAAAGASVDSALVGRLTGAATTAMLTGADVGQAVTRAGLAYAATGAPAPANPIAAGVTSAAAATSGGATMLGQDDSSGYALDAHADPSADYVFGGNVISMGTGFASQALDAGAALSSGSFATTSTESGYVDPSGMDSGTVIAAGTLPNEPPLAPGEVSSGFDINAALSNVTDFALKALQVYGVYQKANSPPVRAPGPTQSVNTASGTITTVSPSGQVTVARPQMGLPVAAPDGTLLVNNGDGTFTLIAGNGMSTRHPYAGTTPATGSVLAGVSTAHLMLFGGLGLGALYLLTRR